MVQVQIEVKGAQMETNTDLITKFNMLRKAAADMVGASTKEELEAMELALRSMPGIAEDKINAINLIHALLKTAD